MKSTRLLSLVMAMVLTLLVALPACVMAAENNIVLEVASVSAADDTSATATISITENPIGVAGLLFDVTYPAELSIQSASVTGVGADFAINAVNQDYDTNTLRAAFANATDVTGTGAVMQIVFEQAAGFELNKRYKVNVTCQQASTIDAALAEIGHNDPIGTVYMGNEPDYLLGDVDNSGKVDVLDAMRILQSFVGKYTIPEGAATVAADVNKNGEVDMYDALLVLRHAVGLVKEL